MRILIATLLGSAVVVSAQDPAPAQVPAVSAVSALPVENAVPLVTSDIQPLASADLDSPYASPRDAARHWLQAALAGLREQRDIRAGMRGFGQAFLLDRSYAAAAFNLGIIAAIAEKWDDAAGAFEEAARLDLAGLGAEAKPQIERARLLASLQRTAEGRRKRRYDEALNTLLPALPKLTTADAITALAQLGRIDPARWEAPALLAGLEGNGTAYDVAEKFLEIATKNAADAKGKARLESALRGAQREVRYASHRASAESAAEAAKYSEAAESYENAWADAPARSINGMEAASARLLSDDTEHASALLLRLQQSGDPAFATLAAAMLKELAPIEPAAKVPTADEKDFFRDPGPAEPIRIADLIPPIDRGPLEIYSRQLPRLVDDPEPVVLLASLAADPSTIPQNVQFPALGSPAIAGEQPWSELKPLLAARASADGPKPSRTLESVDLAGSGRVRRTVLVTSEPTGAQVYLGANTNPLCQTPCGIQVSEGTYSLRTTLAGYQDSQQSVQTAGADREIRATLTPIRGNVIVETPSPGSVAINGTKGAAQSPVELALLPGIYRIGVDFGSGMQERVITIKPATRLRLQMHP